MNTTTIEGRAKRYADKTIKDKDSDTRVVASLSYLTGAYEQRKLDIDKVCDLILVMLNDGTIETREILKVNKIIRDVLGND